MQYIFIIQALFIIYILLHFLYLYFLKLYIINYCQYMHAQNFY